MSDSLPAEWDRQPVVELFDFPVGQVDPRSGDYPRWVLIAPDHIESGSGRLLSEVSAQQQGAISGKYLVAPGDVIYSKIRPYLRKAVIAEQDCLCSADMYPLRPRSGVAPRFLLGLVLSEKFSRFASAVSMRSGFPKINRDEFSLFVADVPPVAEQHRIAEILDALDRAIRASEQVITKLEMLKRGLLYDLLTRGVDENGEVRDPERNRSGFMSTPLGLLPRTWRADPIASLLADVDPPIRSGPFGSALLKSELVEHGVPLLGIDNVHVEKFVAEYSRFVRHQKAIQLARYLVRPNDLMITIMGTVGRCCVVPTDIGEALSSKHVWTISLHRDLYSPYLACLQINHAPWVLRQIAVDTQGAIMSAIRSQTLRNLLLPRPPMHEQHIIEARLKAVVARVSHEQQALHKLTLLRHGLTDDLLSGRVRVFPHPR